jgi:DNA replication and repair protein RecF
VDAAAGSAVLPGRARDTAAGPRIWDVALRDFRSYERAELRLGDGLTVIVGPNGAGKTNLLEAIYCGCTGRSCRAAHEREVVRFGATATRVAVAVCAPDGRHDLTVAFAPGEAKRLLIDGAAADSLMEVSVRPLLTVFLPERLELVKGPPAVRRSHLDQLVAALWPTRVATRRSYAQTLAQRNALISRIRSHGMGRQALEPWDQQLARHGIALMEDRAAAVAAIDKGSSQAAAELGLDGEVVVRYRPRSRARGAEELAAELSERTEADLERGFTTHGPHRDELALLREGRELRSYGSQGQQRLALLALLLAEREAIARLRGALPVALLDDVMSELDRDRRQALVARLRDDGGQAVITASEPEHVPGSRGPDVTMVSVSGAGTITVHDSPEA